MDWDAPGQLAVVMQGALLAANAVEVATHALHWRQLFPRAEIVLSVSESDILAPVPPGTTLGDLVPHASHGANGALRNALAAIRGCCDRLVTAAAALPLPPIKSDTPKLNNVNLQIAAAQAGLAAVTARHVLRVRNDLVFLDREFLDQFEAGADLPRGARPVFAERILISWLFTLNPYTLERMPFSFSDWFSFGLLADVRQQWDVPPMSLADSVFFETRDHNPDSTPRERQFLSRVAVEQHIAFAVFSRHFPDLRLERTNDRHSADASLEILRDNFVLCDLAATGCRFPKYAADMHDRLKSFHCLTPADWLDLARHPGEAPRAVLAGKLEAAAREGAPRQPGAGPHRFGVDDLKVGAGRRENGRIVSTGGTGPLFFGPYAAFGAGRYVAEVQLGSVEGRGLARLRVTGMGGQLGLARAEVPLEPTRRTLRVPFAVGAGGIADWEVVCHIEGGATVSVLGLTVRARGGRLAALAKHWRQPRSPATPAPG